MIIQIPLPPHWVSKGWLPPFDPEDPADTIDTRWLGEEIWWAKSPGGQYMMDISWRPVADPAGEFFCRLIEDGDYAHPVEAVRTRSTLDAAAWASTIADQLHTLIGSATSDTAR